MGVSQIYINERAARSPEAKMNLHLIPYLDHECSESIFFFSTIQDVGSQRTFVTDNDYDPTERVI